MSDDYATITIAHSMEVSYTAMDGETGLSYDTTVRIKVHPDRGYPEFVPVTMLWLASTYIFHGMADFTRFRDDFEDVPQLRYQVLLDHWPIIFGTTETALKKIFAPAKPVVKRPPWSLCPRCHKPIWAREGEVDLREARQLLDRNPKPLWCRTCGQRFSYATGDYLSCSDDFSVSGTAKKLGEMFPADQPTIDTLLIESDKQDNDGRS